MALASYPENDTHMVSKSYFTTCDEDGLMDFEIEIELPMPPGLTFADTASYENAELGSLGGAFADGNMAEAAKSYIGPQFKEQSIRALRDMGARIGGNRARAKMGVTPNPNTRALFKQVNLRTFQFTYKMIPESDEEANQIYKITNYFRQELYPQSTVTQPVDFETGYFFPKRWQIMFFLRNTSGGWFSTRGSDTPQLQPAYLTSFQTSYNTGGNTMFVSPGGYGRFSEVDVSMTFMESKTLFKKDIRENYY